MSKRGLVNFFGRVLTSVATTLTEANPLWFLAAYFTVAFAFGYAYVYTQGFYAPYARYEPEAQADAAALASTITTAIQRNLAARDVSTSIIDDWKLDTNQLRVVRVTSQDGMSIQFSVSSVLNGPGKQMNMSLHGTLPLSPVEATLSDDGKWENVRRAPSLEAQQHADALYVKDSIIFNYIFADKNAPGFFSPVIELNSDENAKLTTYLAGVRGDPTSFTGGLARMLYVSAIVITTLGFGDIVPITTTARTLVAVEAMSGVLLAGLFINAVANRPKIRRRQKRSTRSPAPLLPGNILAGQRPPTNLEVPVATENAEASGRYDK